MAHSEFDSLLRWEPLERPLNAALTGPIRRLCRFDYGAFGDPNAGGEEPGRFRFRLVLQAMDLLDGRAD